MMLFSEKIAVITGAGSGLGRALALQLYQTGASLALCDLDIAGLEETRAKMGERAHNVSLHVVDVSKRDQMWKFASDVVSRYGRVDILINNAGIALTPTWFDKITESQFEQVINANMWGVYYGIEYFLPHLRKSPEASIVNISSLAGLVGVEGYAPYAMSKAAVRALSEVLQSELVGTKISLLVVYPGGIKTNIIKNAPNLSDDRRQSAHDMFTKMATLTADSAARKILRAMKAKRYRLVIGLDAHIVNLIQVLFPNDFPKILHNIFGKAMFN